MVFKKRFEKTHFENNKFQHYVKPKMKTFAQKSREYYNKLAEGYNDSLEARYTMRFKRMLLNEIVIEPEEQLVGCCLRKWLLAEDVIIKTLAERIWHRYLRKDD